MWITILGIIISSIISVILSDEIIHGINIIFAKIGISKHSYINGRWKATYIMKSGKTEVKYVENIILKKKINTIYGYVVKNINDKQIDTNPPLRLKGFILDNRYFTGIWYHPTELSRYHGAYQLLIDPNFIQMNGQWIGYNETKQTIENGIWEWEKMD